MGLELLGFLPYCNNLIITWYDIILLDYTPVFDDCKYLFFIFLHFFKKIKKIESRTKSAFFRLQITGNQLACRQNPHR